MRESRALVSYWDILSQASDKTSLDDGQNDTYPSRRPPVTPPQPALWPCKLLDFFQFCVIITEVAVTPGLGM